ncbi:hypothetical protein C1645_813396 [Glomus cerebriforme]|uniref:Uncharacterized protein n=1 Tax=Glomus cerebriforme TaxID=658196 RepID=A0A397TKU9_9GLOM|nr:hypothetical protein C1645_813396 [Glomus cerebriforme]
MHTPLLPIRLEMKTHTSDVCSSSTEAINICYEKVFHSNAKFPNPQVMGFNNTNIIQQLLGNIIFHSYMISLEKLNVIVLGMGKSKKSEWNYAEKGYKSVFQSNYNENQSFTFWQAFHDALENTNRGPNVAANTVSRARQYAHINGPSASQAQKPIVIKDKLGQKKKENLEQFFSDKANIIMNSYKTDVITQEPVHYLKNIKQELWEKFHEKYPNGVK